MNIEKRNVVVNVAWSEPLYPQLAGKVLLATQRYVARGDI
jgi:hypothetical protein